MLMKVEDVAKVCHEANRAYCQSINDKSHHSWNFAPEWQKKSVIDGVRFQFMELNAGRVPSPSRSHNEWLKAKQSEGWVYGDVKDADKMTHPCCVEYDKLHAKHKQKDYLFCAIVESFFNGGNIIAQ